MIHYVISSSWVCICKGKCFGHHLQACDVINKPNLDVILHFDIGYMDFSRLRTSPDYLNWLKKDVFAMTWQLGPPTFFVTFTSVESKWFPLIKCLYDLNSKKIRTSHSYWQIKTQTCYKSYTMWPYYMCMILWSLYEFFSYIVYEK